VFVGTYSCKETCAVSHRCHDVRSTCHMNRNEGHAESARHGRSGKAYLACPGLCCGGPRLRLTLVTYSSP
jgi:hypothetical protein